ncbi:hypothetical protein D3C84_869830 [compost metagenome]
MQRVPFPSLSATIGLPSTLCPMTAVSTTPPYLFASSRQSLATSSGPYSARASTIRFGGPAGIRSSVPGVQPPPGIPLLDASIADAAMPNNDDKRSSVSPACSVYQTSEADGIRRTIPGGIGSPSVRRGLQANIDAADMPKCRAMRSSVSPGRTV